MSTRALEVYVAAHCATCAEARRLAKIADTAFPDLVVQVVDVNDRMDTSQQERNQDHSDQVVAVPTYILDGRVIALGNPSQEELFAVLASSHASPAETTQLEQTARSTPCAEPASRRDRL